MVSIGLYFMLQIVFNYSMSCIVNPGASDSFQEVGDLSQFTED